MNKNKMLPATRIEHVLGRVGVKNYVLVSDSLEGQAPDVEFLVLGVARRH